MEIKDHILYGDDVSFQKSPNHSSVFSNGLPDTLVIHYTAGSSLSGSVRALSTPAHKASAHLVIGKDGQVVQLVPFNTIAWHAGPSRWNGRTGLNKYSIGIELDNPGLLKKTGSGYQSWFGRIYNEADVIMAKHRNEDVDRYWHIYTEKQLEVNEAICRLLIETYDIKEIVGHEEISPGLKIDPGPAFPLDKFRQKLLHPDRHSTDDLNTDFNHGIVTASSLNIRIEPDAESDKAALPLSKDTSVEILEEKDGWFKVRTDITGWVYGKYIKQKT